MKISKPVLVAIALVVIVGVALGINAYVGEKVKVAVALEKSKQLEAEKAQSNARIDELTATIAEDEAALDADAAARAQREREFQAQLAATQHATPAQLVDQGSTVIGANDIRTDGVVVTMGVETYRKFVLVAVNEREYREVREPAWNAREVKHQKERSDWIAKDIERNKKDALNESIIGGLHDVISHQKKIGLFEKIAWTAAGFGAGVFAQKLIK